MEFRELLMKRRSCRSFTGGTMTKSQLDYILTAATRAPNACNMQSWHFTAVCGADAVVKFAREACRQDWIQKSSVVIVVSTDREGVETRFGDRGRDLFALQDTACAMNNILLAAADMGFGGCFVGAFDEDACRKALNLSERYRPVALAAIGTVDAEVPLRDRKPMEDVVDIIGELPDGEPAEEPKEEEKKPFELRRAYLPDAVFDDLYLGNAVFNNICLANAKFTDITFAGSAFGGLCMNDTKFGCVDMKNAAFDNPDLTGTTFKNCTLKDVKIENCDIDGLTIDGVNVKDLLKND